MDSFGPALVQKLGVNGDVEAGFFCQGLFLREHSSTCVRSRQIAIGEALWMG